MSERPAEPEDHAAKYLILGALSVAPRMMTFPVQVRQVRENVDDNGTIQSFSIVTQSGLSWKVSVELEEQADAPVRR